MRPEGSAAELERRRRRAVRLVDAGERPGVVARILGVAPSSLSRWRRLSHLPDGLAAKKAPGPVPGLSDERLAALEVLLRQGAVAHGWANHLWTAKRVAVLIRRHFGIDCHPEHVRKILKRRLRWTSQKPQKHARECDDKEVERWLADEWPRIIRQAFQRRARIALLDESGFMLSPTVRRTLAPRGKTPVLACSDKHDRISVISAITLSPRARRVGLHFILLGKNENFHAEEVVLFLRQLKGGGGRAVDGRVGPQQHPRAFAGREGLAGQAQGGGDRGFPLPRPGHQPGRGGVVVDQIRAAVQLGSRRRVGIAPARLGRLGGVEGPTPVARLLHPSCSGALALGALTVVFSRAGFSKERQLLHFL